MKKKGHRVHETVVSSAVEHIFNVTDTRYFWIQRRVQDGDLSIKKVPSAKNCADVGTKPVSASMTTTTLQVCKIGKLLTMDPTLHYKMKADEADDGSGEGLQPRFRQRPDMHTETRRDHGKPRAQKQTVVSVDREHRDGCAKLSETSEWRTSLSISHDERIMTANTQDAARNFLN